MSRTRNALAALGVLGVMGLSVAACEDEEVVEIETPDGEIALEEDGDIDIDE